MAALQRPISAGDILNNRPLTLHRTLTLTDFSQTSAHPDDGLALQARGPNLRKAYVGLGFAPDVPSLSDAEVFKLHCAAQISLNCYRKLTLKGPSVPTPLPTRARIFEQDRARQKQFRERDRSAKIKQASGRDR